MFFLTATCHLFIQIILFIIYQVNGENGIVAYVNIVPSGTIDRDGLCVRRLWKDGKAVIFFSNPYGFAKGIDEPKFIFRGELVRVDGDTITVPYTLKSGEFGKKHIRDGELRLKWDDKAYWFGIEDIIY